MRLFSIIFRSFETMSKNLRLDHDAVQSARKHKDPPPRFHYEDRSFTIVEWVIDILVSHNGAKVHVILLHKITMWTLVSLFYSSFPDLSDSEVEINIVRGLNIPLPSGRPWYLSFCVLICVFLWVFCLVSCISWVSLHRFSSFSNRLSTKRHVHLCILRISISECKYLKHQPLSGIKK